MFTYEVSIHFHIFFSSHVTSNTNLKLKDSQTPTKQFRQGSFQTQRQLET